MMVKIIIIVTIVLRTIIAIIMVATVVITSAIEIAVRNIIMKAVRCSSTRFRSKYFSKGRLNENLWNYIIISPRGASLNPVPIRPKSYESLAR